MTIENSYIFSMEEILAMGYLQLVNLGVSSVGPSMHGITGRDENGRSQRKSNIHTNFKGLERFDHYICTYTTLKLRVSKMDGYNHCIPPILWELWILIEPSQSHHIL